MRLDQRNQPNDKNLGKPETRIATWRTTFCKTTGRFKTKHLRRRKPWRQKFNLACAAVADERVTLPARDKHTLCAYTVCAGNARRPDDAKSDLKEQPCFWKTISNKTKNRDSDSKTDFGFSTGCLTACVTRWWAGRDNAALTEPTSSHVNCLKTRRVPPVGCTLC